jgi:hypothetical protein
MIIEAALLPRNLLNEGNLISYTILNYVREIFGDSIFLRFRFRNHNWNHN